MDVVNSGDSFRHGIISVSPIVIFLLIYLASSVITGDFYKMPLSVAMLVSSVWAILTLDKKLSLSQRIEIFSKEAGSVNVLYMIWIFILAGSFAAMAEKTGAVEATVNITLKVLPSFMIVPGIFVATCLISMAIGTSVGTVVAITPLAVNMAQETGLSVPFFVAIVLGGAFFGDNLSFISDTTIAATRTQKCDMRDKFFENIRIVLPAAIIALVLYCLVSPEIGDVSSSEGPSSWLVIPYLLVIILAIKGVNVTVVLLAGILSVIVSGMIVGYSLIEMFSVAGDGIDSVGNLIVVTLLAAGMLGVIKYSGGIDFILRIVGHKSSTSKGAQASIVFLVAIVNLCTANNTVAIITVGSLARSISQRYGIPSRRVASLLDTGSCIVQSLIPYGAQMLMAASLAGISPVAPLPYLFYPQILILCLLISIWTSKNNLH